MESNSKIIWRNFLNNDSEINFTALYNHYVDKLYSYGIYLGYDSETCKDAIQDVFIKIHTDSSNLETIKNHGSFLFKSFKNRLIDIFRSNKKGLDIEHIEESHTISTTVLDDIIDKERADILKEKVEVMLSQLTPTQREAVYMRYITGMEYSEISKLMDIRPDSARKLMHRAIEKLREQNIDEFTKAALLITILSKL